MLRTSALQLSRFIGAFLRGGELDGARILEPATVDTILTLHYPQLYDYGLLWSGEDWIGLPTWNHGGVYFGTRTLIWLFPEEDVGGVVLTNGESTDGMWDIARRVMLFSLQHSTAIASPPSSPSQAVRLALRPSRPNPTHGSTAIQYELPVPEVVSLRIFDIQGRLVRTLVSDVITPAGAHVVPWDGRDGMEREVPAGVYHYLLSTRSTSRSGKITLIR
jgi:hypothetical protein